MVSNEPQETASAGALNNASTLRTSAKASLGRPAHSAHQRGTLRGLTLPIDDASALRKVADLLLAPQGRRHLAAQHVNLSTTFVHHPVVPVR